MTLSFPPHQENRLKEILYGIPTTQKLIFVVKWHRVLGELCYMDIALPDAWVLFGHIQEALHHVEGKMVVLTKGFHQALTDFQCPSEDLNKLPTRLYELVLIQPTMDGYHDASGYMCGGAVPPGPTLAPRTSQPYPSAAATSLDPTGAHPIVWGEHFTVDVIEHLVSWGNPEG